MREDNLLDTLVSVFGPSQVYIVDDHGIRTAESDADRIHREIREQHQGAIRYFEWSIMSSWRELRDTHSDNAETWQGCENWPEHDLRHLDNLGAAYRLTDDGARVMFDNEACRREARARVNSISSAWWERLDSVLDRQYGTGHHKRAFLDATVTAQIGDNAVSVRVTHKILERAHGLVHRFPLQIRINNRRGTIAELKALQATEASAPSV